MAVTGRTGADAISLRVTHICKLIVKFGPKLTNVIAAAQAAGAISAADASAINAFISCAQAACVAWQKLAAYSGF